MFLAARQWRLHKLQVEVTHQVGSSDRGHQPLLQLPGVRSSGASRNTFGKDAPVELSALGAKLYVG